MDEVSDEEKNVKGGSTGRKEALVGKEGSCDRKLEK